MKMTKISVMVIAAFISTSVFAGLTGPKLKTRADVIVLPDDSVVLADPFIDADASTQSGEGPLLQLLNPRIYQTIAIYKSVSENINSKFAARQSAINAILNQLLDKRTNLRFYGLPSAEEMNKYCFAGRPIYTIPSGAKVEQAACTRGNDTFIVKPLFLKLSLRDQAMLLIHERLTTIADDRGWINFVAIAKYTTGLNTYLNLYNDQVKRIYRELTDDEQKKLTNFYASIVEIENRNEGYGAPSATFNWLVHKNGGGLYHPRAIVSESAFISLNTTIFEESELGDNSKVINVNAVNTYNPGRYSPNITSLIGFPLKLGANSVLENVSFNYQPASDYSKRVIRIGENSKIQNTNFAELRNEITIGNSVTVKNSKLYQYNTYLGNDVVITDSEIIMPTFTLGNGVVIQNSKINYNSKSVKINSNEQLINQSIVEADMNKFLPVGVVPKPISQSLKVPNFKCVLGDKLEKKSFGWEANHIDSAGNGAKITGWGTYNGRNGLKKEYEYNYSDVVINVNYSNFQRSTVPVTFLSEQGQFVVGDYLKPQVAFDYGAQNVCVSQAIGNVLSNSGYNTSNGRAVSTLSL
ncbi:hypothetical protein SHI21_09210 [Bacteriovorax sp. PP10]|uniref:Uncharacterized protein n=1 Tax=Bacteriovorax antarcticus TaxID=3088717 RepID=A0ABU5VTJ4_9BACT|nr:hypothetical protein [Bacteriovorax sp. PP10]MEA9356380.1 hypothetical protein [Bacteriovorax sp. PP10]